MGSEMCIRDSIACMLIKGCMHTYASACIHTYASTRRCIMDVGKKHEHVLGCGYLKMSSRWQRIHQYVVNMMADTSRCRHEYIGYIQMSSTWWRVHQDVVTMASATSRRRQHNVGYIYWTSIEKEIPSILNQISAVGGINSLKHNSAIDCEV